MKKNLFALIILSILMFATACSDDDDRTYISEGKEVTEGVQDKNYAGFYLLSEGSSGTNTTTLDFFNYGSGYYGSNIFPEQNPTISHEIGDTGNSIKEYKDRLFIVVNKSHKVDVLRAGDAKKVGQIDVKFCRNIAFHGNYAYVSSGNESGSTEKDDVISKVNLSTLKVEATLKVGRSPEGMVVVDNKLYVANSGGFDFSNAKGNDNTVSIVDLKTFKEDNKIEVNSNPYNIFDHDGKVYVISRDVYATDWSTIISNGKLEVIDTKEDNKVSLVKDLSPYVFSQVESSLYYIANGKYEVLDLPTGEVIGIPFASKAIAEKIKNPYGLLVNKGTGEVYITDAADYTSEGFIYCVDNKGNEKWSAQAGINPAHMTFVRK